MEHIKASSAINQFYSIAAYVYLAAIIVVAMFLGMSPLIFLAFVLMAIIFILPSSFLGLTIIVSFTMIFERFFTLQSLVLNQDIYKIYPLDIIIGLAVIAWLISLRINKKPFKILFDWPERILLIFIIITCASFFRSLANINTELAVAFSTFKNYALYPILYFLVIFIVQNKEQFKKLINTILLSGLAIITFIVIGAIRGQGLWTEFTPLSTTGVRLLASTHAFYLLLVILIATSLVIFDRFWNKGVIFLIIWVWIIGIMTSMMRHLWLALPFGLMIIFLLLKKNNQKKALVFAGKNILIALSIIAIIIMAVVIFNQQDNFDNISGNIKNIETRFISILETGQDTSVNWRIGLWQSAKKSWQASPIFGIGLGRNISLEVGDWRAYEEVRNLHNSLLAITIQMGILGITAFGLFILSVLAKSWKVAMSDPELKPYFIGIIACILTILFCSLFQPYLETNLTGIFLWLMLGILRTSAIIINQHVKNTTSQ